MMSNTGLLGNKSNNTSKTPNKSFEINGYSFVYPKRVLKNLVKVINIKQKKYPMD